MALELYHNDMSVCAQKVRIVLAEKGVEFVSHHLDLRAGDQHDPDYLKLNPNGVVPTIVHDGFVVIESNIIIQYVDDTFPGPSLTPADPKARARMRHWLLQLDTGVHNATGTLTYAVSTLKVMRERLSEKEFEDFIASVPPAKQAMRRSMLEKGVEAPVVVDSVRRLGKLFVDMEATLADGRQWITGDSYTLADASLTAYTTKMEMEGVSSLWTDSKPHLTDWYARARDRKGYQEGLVGWVNPVREKQLREGGGAEWPKVRAILTEMGAM